MPKIEAVIVPPGYAPAGNDYNRMARLTTEFGPLLGATGTKRVWKRDLADGRELLSIDPADTLLFPTGHAMEYQPRYTWTDRPQNDGVQFGTLVETPANAAQ